MFASFNVLHRRVIVLFDCSSCSERVIKKKEKREKDCYNYIILAKGVETYLMSKLKNGGQQGSRSMSHSTAFGVPWSFVCVCIDGFLHRLQGTKNSLI